MRGIWAGSVTLLLALGTADAGAQDVGAPHGMVDARAQSDASVPGAGAVGSGQAAAVSLGRPEPASSQRASDSMDAPADSQVRRAGYDPAATLDPPQPLVRGQSPDWPPPSPPPGVAPPVGAPPPPPGAIPVAPNDPYNCGVVTQPPPAPSGPLGGFFNKCQNLLGGNGSSGRGWFQSDHCFDNFASPVTNPFLFEDPRALTEFRPIFMVQGTPLSNITFHGGDIEYLGLQGRVAINERWSIVLSEIGVVWSEPHSTFDGFDSHDGVSELRIGPKYTFFRCESSGTVAAVGLNFDIASGDSKVFQDTGTLSLEPYISVAQNFGRTSFGSFNVMSTSGYSVATDDQRTDFLFTSLHLDFDVANTHKIYPFIEMNDFLITEAGKAIPNLDFEGRDLFNFGGGGTSGDNTFTMAVGTRYKFNEHLQVGAAYEFPIGGHRDLIDYRLTFDLILRY